MSDQIYSVDATQRAFDTTWATAEDYLKAKNTGKFLGALAFQDVDYDPLEATLRELVALVDARLNTKDNFLDPKTKAVGALALFPGKVLVQPRGSFASRTALRGHVDLDLDLCFPENFKIKFEGIGDRTIAQVLGASDVFSANPSSGHDSSGNLIFTKDGLCLVLIYVWGKLVSKEPETFAIPKQLASFPLKVADNFSIGIVAGLKPTMLIHPTKTLAKLTRSLSAQITSNQSYKDLDVDFFVKVATTRFGGEEVLVGVDKDGPLGARQYQTTTFIPSGKEWIGNIPLAPIDRTALLALKWWKNSFAQDKTIPKFEIRDPQVQGKGTRAADPAKDIKIKSHHFLSVLNALHELPPTDPLYIPTYSSLPFSLVRVMDVMIKVLTFLERAYQPPQRFTIVLDEKWSPDIKKEKPRAIYPFPQVSCGVFDTIYKQASNNIAEYDGLVKSMVIPSLITRLKGALDKLAKDKFTPSTYVFEEL
ncbi:hypothetical protein AX17_002976 [Amanita inopinata Kibby_2008]|nr:hypothetical protein AX17_002976 [Amanita inopinata Kibby_2008]